MTAQYQQYLGGKILIPGGNHVLTNDVQRFSGDLIFTLVESPNNPPSNITDLYLYLCRVNVNTTTAPSKKTEYKSGFFNFVNVPVFLEKIC